MCEVRGAEGRGGEVSGWSGCGVSGRAMVDQGSSCS